jgi:hypothetical protein
MRWQLPPEMQYWVSLLAVRWQRAKENRDDRGIETLEVIIWAAVLTVAAVGAGAFVVSRINDYQSRIR